MNLKLETCLKEIDIVQANIARFDQNGLNIKSWCLALWSGLTAIGIQSGNVFIVLMSVVVVSAFAFIEVTYRRFQMRFIFRSAEIEDILRTNSLDAYEYAVNTSATRSNPRNEFRFVLRSPQFAIFYLMLMAMTVFIVVGMILNPQLFSGFDASAI
ncbi:MAG: hypothetical protein O3A14_04900 [Cyanobacteria bacterium]|nr:hypothetical protein [Cyanobacteriota bacterium]